MYNKIHESDLSKKLFLLGAEDPEMDLVEKYVSLMNYEWAYASIGGTRCNPSSAYNADKVSDKELVYVECKVPSYEGYEISIDHHNEGDFGYYFDHKDFVKASSIGQLFQLVVHNDFEKAVINWGLELHNDLQNDTFDFFTHEETWYFKSRHGIVKVPAEVVNMAAVDHCLSDAYAGKCVGVNHDTLWSVRSEDLSKSLKVAVDHIYETKENFESVLNDAIHRIEEGIEEILDLTFMDMGLGYSMEYLVLREVSLMKSIPVAVIKREEIGSPQKLMLLSLKREQVENFLANPTFKGTEINKPFGVPTRGYAGGLIG
jgi:hypothetical protein